MTMTLDMYFRTKWYDKRLKETVDSLLKNDEILAKWERIKAATAQISKQHKQSSASSQSTQYEQETYGEAETELLAQIQMATFDDPTANLSFSGGNTSRSVVTLGQEYAEAIWTPDLYFPDAIEILRPGKGLISDSMVLALYDDCELFQSMRLQVKSRCKLELRWFPMDIQRCEICVESYQYHTDDVRIMFWEKKVVLDGERLEKYGTANFYIDYDNSWNRTIERESFSECYTCFTY
ncbi:ligand-gated ion channel 50-like [Convolutriloba macropyga]|uniref:ligand-gated ion channel 50-like n=1 Tax=Convolutriloba macropyga TaxID=536237 RepID=UPI003F51FB31